jgi:N-acetyl-alpha-D-glucosaminyl L-malate synthase BshA
MVEVSRYEKLDILHVHYAVPHATSAYLAKQILGEESPKVITTLHGTDITLVGTERSYLPITRFSIEQSDAVTAPSEYLKHATYDKLNVTTSTQIDIIPNFVDTALYCPPEPGEKAELAPVLGACPISENIKVLTHVSNFRPVKRVLDVVRIFDKVSKRVRSHLILIGDGPDRSAAEALVHELDLQEKVCFLGKQQAFVPVLKCSDIFLLPSESESFGLAALEAMSCGIPVIASNTQGIPEVVQNGHSGFLSNVGDIDSMAANCIKVLENQELFQKLSKNARQTVLEKYEREKIVDLYEDYYRKILT